MFIRLHFHIYPSFCLYLFTSIIMKSYKYEFSPNKLQWKEIVENLVLWSKQYVCGSKEIGVPNLSSARSLCANIIEIRARKSELLIGSNICSGNRLPSLCRIPLELTFIIWLLRRLVRCRVWVWVWVRLGPVCAVASGSRCCIRPAIVKRRDRECNQLRRKTGSLNKANRSFMTFLKTFTYWKYRGRLFHYAGAPCFSYPPWFVYTPQYISQRNKTFPHPHITPHQTTFCS